MWRRNPGLYDVIVTIETNGKVTESEILAEAGNKNRKANVYKRQGGTLYTCCNSMMNKERRHLCLLMKR